METKVRTTNGLPDDFQTQQLLNDLLALLCGPVCEARQVMLSIVRSDERAFIVYVVEQLYPVLLGTNPVAAQQAADAVVSLGRTALLTLTRGMQVGGPAQRLRSAWALAVVAPRITDQDWTEVFANVEIVLFTSHDADLVLACQAIKQAMGVHL